MKVSANEDIRMIEELLEQLSQAYVARDWDRFTSHYADDAIWMPPGQPPLVGKGEWWSWIGEKWDQSTIELMNMNHEEIVITGDWAYEWHTETQAGPGWQRNFKGILILVRLANGSWKISRYCFNHSPVDE